MKSPLGFEYTPEQLGRGGTPTMAELAAEQGTNRSRGGEEIRHVCPECGGALSQGGVVVLCRPAPRGCGGDGSMTDEQFDAYSRTQGV